MGVENVMPAGTGTCALLKKRQRHCMFPNFCPSALTPAVSHLLAAPQLGFQSEEPRSLVTAMACEREFRGWLLLHQNSA